MFKTILLFVVLAFALRIIFIFQGTISFHYDMARDAFVAQQIWQDHQLKILGPPTSIPNLYHGVLYYYLIAPFYFLSQGDPRAVAVFLSLVNSLAIIPLMLLMKDIIQNRRWILLGGIFYVISFEANQYASWISNPAPAVLTISLFFLFLRIWQRGKVWGLYLATLMAALSTQFQFFLIYLLLLLPIFALLFKVKINLGKSVKAISIAFLGLSSFFIAAIKFDSAGQIFSTFLNIPTASQIDFRLQFSELFLNYINRIAELFTFNFIPINVFLGGLLAILAVFAIRKNSFLLFCLFSNLPIFIFGGHSNTYANIGLTVPAILGVIILLQNLSKFNKFIASVIICLIIISNLYTIFKNAQSGQLILVIPNDMVLKKQLKLIDQTYKLSAGKPFSINTLTLPLWTNTTWAYLYSWYGKSKYGFVPYFTGHDQVGQLGDSDLQKIDKPTDISFFIIEPHVGIPDSFYQQDIDTENSQTTLIKEIFYGDLKLQLRKPKLSE